MLALKIAAGMLPPAIDTITTLDETVDGSEARKNVPSHSQCKSPRASNAPKSHIAPSTISGNSTNVETCTSRWSFAFTSPAASFCLSSFSP